MGISPRSSPSLFDTTLPPLSLYAHLPFLLTGSQAPLYLLPPFFCIFYSLHELFPPRFDFPFHHLIDWALGWSVPTAPDPLPSVSLLPSLPGELPLGLLPYLRLSASSLFLTATHFLIAIIIFPVTVGSPLLFTPTAPLHVNNLSLATSSRNKLVYLALNITEIFLIFDVNASFWRFLKWLNFWKVVRNLK